MINYINIAMLCLIIWSLITSLVKPERILSALFLIGLSQIGSVYPQLGQIRFELMVGIAGIIFILISRKGLKALSPNENAINKYLFFFIIVALLSVPFSVAPVESKYWVEYYFKRCWILFFLCVVLMDNEKELKYFIYIYIVSCLWLASGSLINYFSGANVIEVNGVLRVRGATGILANPNGLANTIVQSIPFVYYLYLYFQKKSIKLLIFATGIVSIIGVFLSGSRGGFYGLIFCTFCIAFFSKQRKRAFVFAGLLLAVSLVFAGPSLVGRYKTILNPTHMGKSGDARIWGLRHGVSMMIKRPVLGVGLGCYHIARQKWFGWRLWAHNHYGQLMGELGLLGIISWSLLIYYTIKGARRIRSEITANDLFKQYSFIYYLCMAIEIGTYTRLVLGMTTHSLHIFFWYLNAGLIVSCSNIFFGRPAKNCEMLSNAKT